MLREGDYNFIMVYQGHLNTFVHLQSFKTKIGKYEAYHLLQVFVACGVLAIFHSDNGREVSNRVISRI